MNTPTRSGANAEQRRRTFAAATRFVAMVVVVAFGVLGLTLWWVHGCKSNGVDPLAHCGRMQRNTLAVGAPLILFLGAIGAFVRTIQVWRGQGRWWIWQGAGWLLLVLMLVVLFLVAPTALL